MRPVHSGDQLLQHHCPVAHVAAEFPVLCEIETQLFASLLGSHVQRLATIAHGDGVCTTHIPTPLHAEYSEEKVTGGKIMTQTAQQAPGLGATQDEHIEALSNYQWGWHDRTRPGPAPSAA